MKKLARFIQRLILLINFLFVVLFIFTAYSPMLNPATNPILSCAGLAFPIFLLINLSFFLFWLFIKAKFTLLPLLGFILCIAPIKNYLPIHFKTKLPPEQHLKILSYNVMGFDRLTKKDGENPILNYLKESQADIICIQEYNASANKKHLTQEDILEALKEYPFYKINKVGAGKSGNQVACFSKFPIISEKTIENQTDYNGSIKYEVAIEQDTITVINNHLESNKLTKADKEVYEGMIREPEAKRVKQGLSHLVRKLAEASTIRSQQVDTLAKEIENIKHYPLIFCGDFNDSPISHTLYTFRKSLTDTFVQSGHGLGISYNQNKFFFRIDHILVSKELKSYQCTVDQSIENSDHYPIWCYIAKKN